jgi:hypothetical protein
VWWSEAEDGSVAYVHLEVERSHFKHGQATSATVLPLIMLLEYLRKLKNI